MSVTSTIKMRQELKRRIKSPLSNETFLYYFFGVVVGFGGLGVWLPNFIKAKMGETPDWAGTSSELIMFSAGILVTALIDLALSEEVIKPLKLCSMLALGFGILAAIVLILINSLLASLVFTAFSLLTWWIANADNEMLYDNDAVTALGGDTEHIQGEGIRPRNDKNNE